METLVNANTAQGHWAEALAVQEMENAVPADNREKLRACLNLFCLARSFYSDAAFAGYEGKARLYRLGAMAAQFRAVFFALAEMLGGRNDHQTRSYALEKLCAVGKWLKSKKLTLGDVFRETDHATRTWGEVSPPQFVSTIFATYAEYRRTLEEDRTRAEAAQQKRKDKYDKPDGESEVTA